MICFRGSVNPWWNGWRLQKDDAIRDSTNVHQVLTRDEVPLHSRDLELRSTLPCRLEMRALGKIKGIESRTSEMIRRFPRGLEGGKRFRNGSRHDEGLRSWPRWHHVGSPGTVASGWVIAEPGQVARARVLRDTAVRISTTQPGSMDRRDDR